MQKAGFACILRCREQINRAILALVRPVHGALAPPANQQQSRAYHRSVSAAEWPAAAAATALLSYSSRTNRLQYHLSLTLTNDLLHRRQVN